MLTTVRIAFPVLFFIAALGGAYVRTGSLGTAAIAVGAAALLLGPAIVLAERRFSRRFAAYHAAVVYGALAGWAAGFVCRTLLASLPAYWLVLDSFQQAVLTLACCYAGAVIAVRARAAGYAGLRVKLRREPTPDVPEARGAIRWIRGLLVVFAAVCAACLALDPGRYPFGAAGTAFSVIILLLAVLIEVLAKWSLAAAVAALLPAVLFALAMAAETFAVLSAASGMAGLNFHISLEAQQLALLLAWLYVGAAFMIQSHSGRGGAPPFFTFEE